MESTDPGDAILDDVIVLWRAFEATFDRSRSDEQNEMAAVALGETIRYHGIQKLPATRALIDRLKHLENASIGQVAEWFGSDADDKAALKGRITSHVAELRQAILPPPRWNDRDSRKLSDLLYRCRCAIIHSGLETNNSLVDIVLPSLRLAMIEIVIGRAAQLESISLDEATKVFDRG